MNTSHPKSSGFDDDFDAKIGNINTRAELLENTAILNQYLEHVDGKLYRAEEVIKKADAAIARIEAATGALERSAGKIEPALTAMADNISKDKRFKFTAQLDDKSIMSVKAEHGEFIEEEKKLLKEHLNALRKSMSESVAEEKQAFENHQKEMERTKEYGEGVWLSKRAWSWISGFLIVSGFWLAASITAAIVLWVKS